ncbi:MAG: ThuA domain-containing protein [Chloroherpetonaceae bacterium]|nr:ThuA domain-containing protein [Chthonomonadaceae bacterium]MDW8208240.1 ThuA domain-containing protein [Chloroherpetonaceae bacterium]
MIRWGIPLLFCLYGLMAFSTGAEAGKKIVFLAGTKSHGPGEHEYEKGLRLLAHCLETAHNLKGYRTEVHLYGWPEDPATLNDADCIVVYCDGSDHDPKAHPLLNADRLEQIGRQMQRGCGIVFLHYATFAPNRRGGPEYLEWAGGYFDYESGTGRPPWYSKIQFLETTAMPATPDHPICRGVAAFPVREEFYYNMRFREPDPRRVPILKVPVPGEAGAQTVAWAVQRRDGGRGFAFTGGHFHSNWQQENFRKLVLNAIVWAARGTVPDGGVRSTIPPDIDDIRVLLLTGHHHPAHDWQATTEALREILARDPRFAIRAVHDPESLATERLSRYHLLLINYCNWERPGLSPKARRQLLHYVRNGGGLVLIHFANGAWQDWPEYAGRLARRVWRDPISQHDPYGTFRVRVADTEHLLTRGLSDFDITDELYCRQQGALPVAPLLTAHSRVTGQEEPLAFVYTEGRGRIFQTLLGHDASALRTPVHAELIRRACAWVARREVLPLPLAHTSSATSPRPRALWPEVNPRRSVDWPSTGNDRGGTRYSRLRQIHRGNVRTLKVAWTYRTGDAEKTGSTIECTPIVVEGVMYLTTVRLKVVALNAATGEELWSFDPGTSGVNRGVAYWSDGKPGGKRRILAAFPDGRMVSLDARTGRPDPEFGRNGFVNLREGIERDISGMTYGCTSPPMVFEDLVILGFLNSESQPGAPGDIRAFHVLTGKEVWRFRTVPLPGEFGNETWENDGWRERSGANAWSGFTLDEKRGIVFCGTGSPASDFYGADRPGMNLFGNCTLALDARTGKRIWHFQTVHHDLWDHDNPCPPVLCTVRHNGRWIDAVAQPTKTGYVFLLDRQTGKPLFEVREVPAPPSDVPGEKTWPTQPVPVRPPALSPNVFTDEDVTDISPEAAREVRERLKRLRYGKPYLPPSLEGTIVSPGFHGGATWSGASFDPTTHTLYINTNNVLYIAQLRPGARGGYDFAGYTYFNDKDGFPANKPPWGHLTAINLNTGEFVWRVALGEEPALKARGISRTGTENFGGTIVTAGGLVFIGATRDEKFRAFDKDTGALLWEYQLPAGGYATPCTYMVNGKQYVVIAAGGGGKLRTRTGDTFIAFALP